jgi:hypothetical protein
MASTPAEAAPFREFVDRFPPDLVTAGPVVKWTKNANNYMSLKTKRKVTAKTCSKSADHFPHLG